MNILLIVNPKAGKNGGRRAMSEALRVYEGGGGIKVFCAQTTAPGDATEIVKKFSGEADRVVCCGGDGTLNETVAGLMELPHPPELGYIPCGTTNDFAATLGLRGSFRKNAKRTLKSGTLPIDIGRFNGRCFTYTASFGAFTGASYSTPQKEKNMFGRLAYFFRGIKDITEVRDYPVQIIADGKNYSGVYMFGAVCNSTSIGGIIHFKRNNVHLNDGFFEAVLIRRPSTAAEMTGLVGALADRDFAKCELITFLHARRVEIKTPTPLAWSLDGEYEEGKEENLIENVPRALRIAI